MPASHRSEPSPPPVVVERAEAARGTDALDWDELPNPRRGRAFNRFRAIAKPALRYASERWLPDTFRGNTRTDPAFVIERHHRVYGVPWAMGREQFDHLVRRGLARGDRVADLGCGALRVGIWLVGYLDEGRYFGVDRHLKSLRAAAEYELPLHGLEPKRPRLLLDASFALDHFGESFDWIVSFSLFIHLEPPDVERAVERVAATLAPGGRFVVNHHAPLPDDRLRAHGLEVTHVGDYPCRLLDAGTGWVEMRKTR